MLFRSLPGDGFPASTPRLLGRGELAAGEAGWLWVDGTGDRCGDVLGLTVSNALTEGLDLGLPPRLYGAKRCWPLVEELLLVGVVGGRTGAGGGGADEAAEAAAAAAKLAADKF